MAQLAASQAREAVLEQQLAQARSHAAQQQRQMLALVQNLQVALVLVDDESRIQFVNQYFWDMFGLAPALPDESGYLPHSAVGIAPVFQDPAAFQARAIGLYQAGRTKVREEFELADGRLLELDYLVLGEGAGRVICYRDVTERHQREARLSILAHYLPPESPTAIIRLTGAGEVLYANPAAGPLLLPLQAHQVLPALAAAVRGRPQHQQELVLNGQFYLATAVPSASGFTLYLVDITGRRLAEMRLASQREFYETVLNVLPIELVVFTEQQRCRFVNPAAIPDPVLRQQVGGLPMDEYVDVRGLQQPPELAKLRKSYLELALHSRMDVTYEETLVDERQREKMLMRLIRPVYQPNGELRMVVDMGIDITARMLAERLQQQVRERLQEREDFIRHVVDALPSLVYLTAPDGTVLFSNKAYAHATDEESRIGRDSRNPVVFQEMRLVRSFNAEVFNSLQEQRREMRYTTADGKTRYYDVLKRPMREADGQLAVLSIATDVTDRKMARQVLESREKRYRDLVHYSQALICTHDLAGNILTVNPAVERLLGRPTGRLGGLNLRELLPPAHHSVFNAYLKGNEAALPEPRLVALRLGVGNTRYLQYYTYRVAEAGAAPYVVASGYDVTEGHLAQRALQKAKRIAEANARAKEDFLARMSHEIRTPLNGVLGMATLLQKTPLTGVQQEYLSTMQVAGRHLLTLVNDVLDMAKITTHHLQLECLPFDLSLMLEGTGQTVAALAAQRGLALVVRPPAAGTRLLGDAYRLRQVLLNLLSNAIKFTERGQIEIGAEVLDEAPAASPGAMVLRFWVADTGIGMSPAELAHIFEAFAQASTDTSRRYGGTGLGLAISQQLVEQMGGVLQVQSEPGKGTAFSFALLLPRDEVSPAPAPVSLPAATFEGLRGLRVLLAEDNLINQQIAKAVLEYWGVQVHAVGNGSDALAQLRENTFDAALLDIRMPGLSGVEVTTAIRTHPDAARATIPIVALTANAFENDRLGYLAAGMNACLTKPYEEAELCQLLLDLTRIK
jgi:PAS domain S-box-containing protein